MRLVFGDFGVFRAYIQDELHRLYCQGPRCSQVVGYTVADWLVYVVGCVFADFGYCCVDTVGDCAVGDEVNDILCEECAGLGDIVDSKISFAGVGIRLDVGEEA